jgi:hypothetical protein
MRSGVLQSHSLEPGYRALLDAGITAGNTLPAADEQNITNMYYAAWRFLGGIAKGTAHYLFVKTGDLNFSYLNVRDPAVFKILPVNTITQSNDGNAGNGTSSYMRTTFNPSGSSPALIVGGCSFVIYVFSSAQGASIEMGSTDSGGRRITFVARNASDQCVIRLNSSVSITITGITDGSGVWEIEQGPGSLMKVYRNGVCLHRAILTTTTAVNQGIFLGAQQNSGGTGDTFSSKVISSFQVGARLTIPAYPFLNALKNNDVSFFNDFFNKVNVIKPHYENTDVSGTTSKAWDAVIPIQRVDLKYDFIAGDETGAIYYFEQGANVTTWTRTLIISTGDELTNIQIWGRDGGKLVLFSAHKEGGSAHLRIHKADTSDDKGTYTTTVFSVSGFPWIQTLRVADIDADGQNELLIAWQGSNNTNGGVSWMDWNGGTITTLANWTTRLGIASSQAWHFQFLASAPTSKFLLGGRNYPNRFTGGNPGVHIVTIASPPTSAWSSTVIYNTSCADPGINRVRDHLHVEFGNFFGTSSEDVLNVNYDTGEIFLFDKDNAYAVTIYNPNLGHQATRCRTMDFMRNGRNCFIVCFEDSWEWLFSWDGTQWTYQQLRATHRHPSDAQWHILDLDNDGDTEMLYADSTANATTGASEGAIKLVTW